MQIEISQRLEHLLDWVIGFNLHTFSSRYGGDIISVMTSEAETSQLIDNCYNGGDSQYQHIGRLETTEWFPIASGKNIYYSMQKLQKSINSIPEEDLKLWNDIVSALCQYWISKNESDIMAFYAFLDDQELSKTWDGAKVQYRK